MSQNYIVYKHVFPNRKVYIGITSKDDPEKRWLHGDGYKSNEILYSAIQQYGWDNIEHQIIASGISKDDAMQLEVELISSYDSTNPNNGYNISAGIMPRHRDDARCFQDDHKKDCSFRPRKESSVVSTVRFPADMVDMIDIFADKCGISRNEFIVQGIRYAMANINISVE